MGTPAIITFRDDDGAYSIYQQYDGYPKDVAASIEAAKNYAWPLPRFEPEEFAAAYVRANKVRGGGIYLTHPGEYDDIEYIYVVTLKDGELWVELTHRTLTTRHWLRDMVTGHLQLSLT